MADRPFEIIGTTADVGILATGTTCEEAFIHEARLEDVRLLRSSGSRLLDDEAVRAVKMANPYNRFPKRITKRRLQINAVFSYMPSMSALR